MISALTITALYTHLFVAGLSARAAASTDAAPPDARVSRVAAPQTHDVLTTRSHSAPLSLHQNTRRADSFAAALTSPSVCLTFAQARARTAHLPTHSPSASLPPTACRAPPSLVA